MKRIRRIVSFMLLLAMLLLLAPACAGEKSDLYKQATARFTGVLETGAVVQVLENDTAIELGYVQQLIGAFNEAYASQGVSAVIMDTDQYADLATDGPYGYGPDVWYQANDILMKYAAQQHLLPLPVYDLACYDLIPSNAWDAYAVDLYGETFYCGVPVNVQSGMLYYIESMLPDSWEQEWDINANGTPDFFETYNALYAVSREIMNDPNGKTQYGYLDELVDTYFMAGFLFTYGAYVFGSNDTDPRDIGFAKGDAAKGANMIRQFAALMNNTESLDKAFASAAYAYLADGVMLCTVTTPDVYRMFIRAMVNSGKWTQEEAEADLKMINVPRLPVSADLESGNWQDTVLHMEEQTVKTIMMGGINGYGISAYTKYPNASLAFVTFATGYDQVVVRHDMLGISPARSDAAALIGETDATVQMIFDNLDNGFIDIMPAITQAAQIWTPAESFLTDLATDVFRASRSEIELYDTIEKIQGGLERMTQQISDAIYTLQ